MDPHFSDDSASSVRIAGAAALRLELEQEAEEDRLASKKKSRVWPMVVAMLVLVAALLVFYFVVRGSLLQSESRHKAHAQHAEALWRCNSLQGRAVLDSCHVQANAEARRLALLKSPETP